MKKLLLYTLGGFLLTGCANIAKGLIFPNMCTRCEIYNTYSGIVLHYYEGCGASNVRIEDHAKIYAFDVMRNGNCNVDVRCTSWRQEPPAEQE